MRRPLPVRRSRYFLKHHAFPVVALLCLSGTAGAQTPGPIVYESYQLPNGLKVVLAPEHSTQVASVSIWYDVGTRNEPPGRTGVAQLLERLMFDGSAHVGRGQHARLVGLAGGTGDAEVEEDVSRFLVTLPSNRLNLGLWLEAERLRYLSPTDSAVAYERRIAREVERQRIAGQPYAAALLAGPYRLYDTATCFGYAHPPIGLRDQLDSVSSSDVRTFFQSYYTPSNARLVVAGDFDPASIRRLIADYFGDIPKRTAPPEVACQPTAAGGPARQTITDGAAALPAVLHFYRIPPHDHADTPALELLGTILGQGQNARLSQRLIATAAVSVATQSGIIGHRRGPGGFTVLAVAAQGVSADSLDTLLTAELTALGTAGVSDSELARAKNFYRASVVSDRQRPEDVAEQLQHAATFHGSLESVNGDFDRYMRVTAEDLRRVAGIYLRPENGIVLLVRAGAAS